MKQNIVKYLRILFPFIITIFLWRLSCPWINPAGILAIIPIFYCSFIRRIGFFAPFAILMCFLIDYKFDTVLFWTFWYCIYYVIINVQTVIDLTHTKKRGVYAFMLFFGIAILSQVLWNFSFMNLLIGILIWILVSALYIPMATVMDMVGEYD